MYAKLKKSMYSKLHVKNYLRQTNKNMYEKKVKKIKYKCHFYATVQNTLVQKLSIPGIKRCFGKYPVLSVIYLINFGAILSTFLNMLGMKKMQFMSFSKEL
jgi:hypothetical protein